MLLHRRRVAGSSHGHRVEPVRALGLWTPPPVQPTRRRRVRMPFGPTHTFIRAIAYSTASSFFTRIHVDGGDEFVPREGPVIVVSNHHNSAVDVSHRNSAVDDSCTLERVSTSQLARNAALSQHCLYALRQGMACTTTAGTGVTDSPSHSRSPPFCPVSFRITGNCTTGPNPLCSFPVLRARSCWMRATSLSTGGQR